MLLQEGPRPMYEVSGLIRLLRLALPFPQSVVTAEARSSMFLLNLHAFCFTCHTSLYLPSRP